MKKEIKQGDSIFIIRGIHIKGYEIERVITQDGKLYAETLVGFNKDKIDLIEIDSDYTDLNLENLKIKYLNMLSKRFDVAIERNERRKLIR